MKSLKQCIVDILAGYDNVNVQSEGAREQIAEEILTAFNRWGDEHDREVRGRSTRNGN